MDLSTPRGVDDIEPERYARQARVRAAFEEVSKIYNFDVMEPASVEHLSTLRAKSGAAIDKEIYSFKDKAGRDLGLRFDLTVGITRYVCSRKGLRLPVKLAASGGMWRYDEPQFGRYRWFHQWDLEVFGPPSVDADAEVIDASSAIMLRAGIRDFTVKVGDRRVVEDYIRTKVGIEEDERVIELMRANDKVEKKTADDLRSEYVGKGFEAGQINKVLDFGKLRGTPDEVLSKASELRLESVGELRTLADRLDSRGVKNVEYNMSVVRGIDYYTGIVFEGADTGNPRLGSLFGGGRYDALPKIFGRPDLSATGAAGGIERIAMSLAEIEGPGGSLVYVAAAGESFTGRALEIQRKVRATGVPCEAALMPKTLSKQLEDADKLDAAWVMIVGEKETRAKGVTLKEMKTGKEELIPFEAALRRIMP